MKTIEFNISSRKVKATLTIIRKLLKIQLTYYSMVKMKTLQVLQIEIYNNRYKN